MQTTRRPPRPLSVSEKWKLSDWLGLLFALAVVMTLTFSCVDVWGRG